MLEVIDKVTKSSIIRRNSFSKDRRICLSGTVLADLVEKELSRYYNKNTEKESLLFDFSESEYIDIAALVNCIATLVLHDEEEIQTYIAYPKLKIVRDFLQVWRFPKAVEAATNSRFTNYLLPEDHHYLNEKQTNYTGLGGAIQKLKFNPDWRDNVDTRRNFFEFITFSNELDECISPRGSFLPAARNVSKKWAEPLINQVLNRHIVGKSPKDDIARVIIYEAMSNAIRHPQARNIQVVSMFSSKSKNENEKSGAPDGSLRICIWDDGESIAATLLKAFQSAKTIHAFKFPTYMYDKVYVRVRNFNKKNQKDKVVDPEDEITDETATEPRLLLLSLFPGVSRNVDNEIHSVDSYDEEIIDSCDEKIPKDPVMSYLATSPGMGLYALKRTVLDQFQGTIFMRSGNCRLIMEVAHDAYRKDYSVKYKCKITKYPKNYPIFRGNLLTIQLPIIHKE